jgi:hypothetical protein
VKTAGDYCLTVKRRIVIISMRLFASMDKTFDFLKPFDSIINLNLLKEPRR